MKLFFQLVIEALCFILALVVILWILSWFAIVVPALIIKLIVAIYILRIIAGFFGYGRPLFIW